MLLDRFTPTHPKIDIVKIISVPLVSASSSPMITGGVETPEQSDIRLLFVGDIMLDRNVKARTRVSGDPIYPFQKLSKNWLASFEYTIGNLEGALTDKRRPPEKSIDFQFDPSEAAIIKSQGIDAVSQANNHALDQGALGYEDSVRRLRSSGLLVFGHQVQDDVIALATTTIQGHRFAFLGFNTTDNPLNRETASSTIALARQQADTVIVTMHWGSEYHDKPDASTVELGHWLIDHGVDIVIGGHPHWAQGISTYKGKPIVWSLGNFIFDQDWSPETRQGLTVEIDIGQNISIKPIPVQIDASQPRVLEGDERVKRLESLVKISDKELADQIRGGVVTWSQYATGTKR